MDEIEIANLLYRCAAHVDRGELAAAASLFRGARVQLEEHGPFLDHNALLEAWGRDVTLLADGTPGTRHLVTNPVITVDRENGRATCESCVTVLQAGAAAVQILGTGQYHDEFLLVDGAWQFATREYRALRSSEDTRAPSPIAAAAPEARPDSPTRAKILAAAQKVFSTVGYSDAGIRRIAEEVGVSPTILFRHFGTKAGLFEEALVDVMKEHSQAGAKEGFGQHIADLLADPAQIICPHAMTVLAIGNEEAREIAARVMEQYTIRPMAQWLGPPGAESRAREIMTLCAGFVLYHSRLNVAANQGRDAHMIDWLARSIQAIVDQR